MKIAINKNDFFQKKSDSLAVKQKGICFSKGEKRGTNTASFCRSIANQL